MTAPPAGTGTPGDVITEMLSERGRRDPYPYYERLRPYGSVIPVRAGLTAVIGYTDCDRALRDPRLRVQDASTYDRILPDWREHSSLRAYSDSMLLRNPPGHARMRRLVSGSLTTRRVNALVPAIERMADDLLDAMAELGAGGRPVDFIAEFASRLPIAVISELLGVAASDHVWFRAVAADVTLALEGNYEATVLGTADAAMDHLAEYFTDLIEHRRRVPGEDMLSALVQAYHGADEGLSHAELVGNMMLLLIAGFETTTFMLGNALLLAFRHPEHASSLRTDPGFATAYVEEVLRFEPPLQGTTRIATEDIELGGATIGAGTKLILMLAAANRDAERFTDPDRFDPRRPNVQPLTFGAGSHFCLGAPLTRLEGQIALPRVLRRFPELAPDGKPVRRNTWIGHGVDVLPVALKGITMSDTPRPAPSGTRTGPRAEWVDRYLKRLGIDHPGPPSTAGLRALHRAHVEQVPYEVIDVHLRRPQALEPDHVAERIQRGRGGYCVQLNGAFAELLTALGYQVARHQAWVQAGRTPLDPDVPSAPHMALTVTVDGTSWFADIGLGDGLHDPLPLRAGTYRQGPFTFRLGPSDLEPGGWRFEHDPRGSVTALDFSLAPAPPRGFADWHPYLCNDPESRLVRALTLMRRDAVSADVMVGCVHKHFVGDDKIVREIRTPDEWFAVLGDVFRLDLSDLSTEQRAGLWHTVDAAHLAWQRARAARSS